MKKPENLACRSAQEVFEDHLQLANDGKLEEDIERNVTDDIVLLTSYGTFLRSSGRSGSCQIIGRATSGWKL